MKEVDADVRPRTREGRSTRASGSGGGVEAESKQERIAGGRAVREAWLMEWRTHYGLSGRADEKRNEAVQSRV